MDNAAAILIALVLAPMAIVVTVALLRGYKFDIHFDRDGAEGGWFSRHKNNKPPDDKPKDS
jgi:hypothetical protein